jgi:hypothetical protein
MAEASITLKLNPAEFKLIQTALEIARLESEIVVKNATDIRAKQQARGEQVQFADLLGKIS